MGTESILKRQVELRLTALRTIDVNDIQQSTRSILSTIKGGGIIYTLGNGGSAAQADHLAAELMGRFQCPRRALPAVNLASSPATLTAIGNDYGYAEVFARQIRGITTPRDLLVTFTTSGCSPNVIEAHEAALVNGTNILSFTGAYGMKSPLKSVRNIRAASHETPIIQELHLALIHLTCQLIDEHLSREP